MMQPTLEILNLQKPEREKGGKTIPELKDMTYTELLDYTKKLLEGQAELKERERNYKVEIERLRERASLLEDELEEYFKDLLKLAVEGKP